MILNLHISKNIIIFALIFKILFKMVKDFYIRYGAKDSKICMLFKYGKLRLTLYIRTIDNISKYLVVKNRTIIFESSILCEAFKYYRSVVFMEIPEPRDLFNQ